MTDLFQIGMMIGTSELYIFIPVETNVPISQDHSCMRKQKVSCSFSQKHDI